MGTEQILMLAGLNDFTIFYNKDHICLTNRRKTMSNHERGTALHQMLDRILNQFLRHRIDGRGGLIKYENPRISQNGPCE